MAGSGTNVAGTSDGFHFVYQPMSGDGEIVARITDVQNTTANSKGGIMIRESLAANSSNVAMVLTGGDRFQLQVRASTGGTTSVWSGTQTPPHWVKLVRSGNTFTAYRSSDGVTWTLYAASPVTVPMSANVYVGLVMTSNEQHRPRDRHTGRRERRVGSASGPLDEPGRGDGGCGRDLHLRGWRVPGGGFRHEHRRHLRRVPLRLPADVGRWGDRGPHHGCRNTTASSKGGIMIRETLAADSSNVAMVLTGGNRFQFQVRASTGGTTSNWSGTQASPHWVKLVRTGNTFTAYRSSDGVTWTLYAASPVTVSMSANVYVGLVMSSNDNTVLGTATLDGNVGAPALWTNRDVGTVGVAGTFTSAAGVYQVAGSGTNIAGTSDGFHFVYQPMSGDGEIVARITDVENTTAKLQGRHHDPGEPGRRLLERRDGPHRRKPVPVSGPCLDGRHHVELERNPGVAALGQARPNRQHVHRLPILRRHHLDPVCRVPGHGLDVRQCLCRPGHVEQRQHRPRDRHTGRRRQEPLSRDRDFDRIVVVGGGRGSRRGSRDLSAPARPVASGARPKGGPLLSRLVPPEERARANDLLDRWGEMAVVATRPVPILAETVAILAGASPKSWELTTGDRHGVAPGLPAVRGRWQHPWLPLLNNPMGPSGEHRSSGSWVVGSGVVGMQRPATAIEVLLESDAPEGSGGLRSDQVARKGRRGREPPPSTRLGLFAPPRCISVSRDTEQSLRWHWLRLSHWEIWCARRDSNARPWPRRSGRAGAHGSGRQLRVEGTAVSSLAASE